MFSNKPWFTSEHKQLCNEIILLNDFNKNNPTDDNKSKFIDKNKEYKRKNRSSKNLL